MAVPSPAYDLVLGSERWTSQVLSLDLRLRCAPVPNALRVVLPATAATLIAALCGDVGADVGPIAEGVHLPYYAADPSRTGYEHIARLAAWGDAVARVGGDGRVTAPAFEAGTPDTAIRYGRDVLA